MRVIHNQDTLSEQPDFAKVETRDELMRVASDAVLARALADAARGLMIGNSPGVAGALANLTLVEEGFSRAGDAVMASVASGLRQAPRNGSSVNMALSSALGR